MKKNLSTIFWASLLSSSYIYLVIIFSLASMKIWLNILANWVTSRTTSSPRKQVAGVVDIGEGGMLLDEVDYRRESGLLLDSLDQLYP